jgi:hypothetical protein
MKCLASLLPTITLTQVSAVSLGMVSNNAREGFVSGEVSPLFLGRAGHIGLSRALLSHSILSEPVLFE